MESKPALTSIFQLMQQCLTKKDLSYIGVAIAYRTREADSRYCGELKGLANNFGNQKVIDRAGFVFKISS
ncbi:MAG: hypothetical protein F6J92_12640 [Symploca sp. SIO1A3]|nr:hypothetical protein [Symploca sp. SIO1A3]